MTEELAKYPSLREMPVLVTGGASGIGADIVRAFHGQGARVGFLDIQDDSAAALVAGCDGAPLYRHCDLTDLDALRTAIEELAKALGPIRCLVNNAANDTRFETADVTGDDWDRAQEINLRPHFFTAQAVRPGMAAAGGGAIINVSSIAWRIGIGALAPYAAAKAGILGLTKSLANAFGPDNIRVNAIEPGAVMTDRQRELWYPTEASVQAMVDQQCLPHVLSGREIARTALFLASDDARMITKQTVIVDAGMA